MEIEHMKEEKDWKKTDQREGIWKWLCITEEREMCELKKLYDGGVSFCGRVGRFERKIVYSQQCNGFDFVAFLCWQNFW
jgi:hypothetical protein